MGLFKRLFGENDEAIHVEVSISCERMNPEIPPANILYKKTCPEMVRYKIRGRNNRTKRLCTVRIVALASDDQSVIIKTADLYDVQSCEVVLPDPATERQISYATDLGIVHPERYSKDDMSCLITRATHEENRDDTIPVDQSLAKLAAVHGIYLSVFSGEKRALNALWLQFTEEEKLRFLAFCIHQTHLRKTDYNLEYSPYLDLYDRFVRDYHDDPRLLRSLSNYIGSDLSLHRELNKQRNAYKIASEYLSK